MRPPGNQISMITIALPVHLGLALERLAWVREQTRRVKRTDRPVGTQKLYQAADFCRGRRDRPAPR